jgi:hypothetical protein
MKSFCPVPIEIVNNRFLCSVNRNIWCWVELLTKFCVFTRSNDPTYGIEGLSDKGVAHTKICVLKKNQCYIANTYDKNVFI